MNFEKLWKKYGTLKKTIILWKNNFGTIPKNMIKYRKLWNYDLLLKQYGIMEKKLVYYSQLWDFDL